MKSLMITGLTLFSFVHVISRTASAFPVTITARGTVLRGHDNPGIFGTPNGDLKGKAFTAVLTIDDSQAVNAIQCPRPTCGSQTYNPPGASHGTAILQIDGHQYTFGITVLPNSGAWSNAGREVVTPPEPPALIMGISVGDSQGNIGVTATTRTSPLPTTDGDWRTPVCISSDSKQGISSAGGSFEINGREGFPVVKGEFVVDAVSVGEPCDEPQIVRGRNPQPGDIVLYREAKDKYYPHVAVIAPGGVAKDNVTVTRVMSKWGRCGLYLHDPDDSPYGREWTVWHSDRPGFHANNNVLETDQNLEYYTDHKRHHISKGLPRPPLTETQCQQINLNFCANWMATDTKELRSATPMYDCRGFVFDAGTTNLPVEMLFSFVLSDPIAAILSDNGYSQVTSAKHTGGKCASSLK